jgi:hypothetical protein
MVFGAGREANTAFWTTVLGLVTYHTPTRIKRTRIPAHNPEEPMARAVAEREFEAAVKVIVFPALE